MTHFSKQAILGGVSALVIAMAAGAASAAHITYSGALADAYDGDPINNLLDGPFDFNASFNADDADDIGGMFTFNFVNDSDTAAVITFADVTIRQSGMVAGFTEGVTTMFGDMTRFTAAGALDSFELMTRVAAGEMVSLIFNYGDAYGTTNRAGNFIGPDIDFTVSATPVPIPAAGFMLLAGLGGLAAARRKKLV